MNGYYSAFLDLRSRACLVIGTGDLCDQKAAALARAGARVARADRFDPDDAQSVYLIVADVDVDEARSIQEFAEAHRIFVNIVDKPEFCSFILPAVLDRGDLKIAVSTGGASPALAGWIRRRLEELFGWEYAILLSELRRTRSKIHRQLPIYSHRKLLYRRLFNDGILDVARNGGTKAVRARLEKAVGEFCP
ncbi:MAG: NAD(P)-dependent oxidoreductase [Acidobacteriota bacterium]